MQHSQWWDLAMKVSWGAAPDTSVDGVDAAVSATAADLRSRTLGKGPSKEEETKYASLVRTVRDPKLVTWKEFEVCRTMGLANIKQIINVTTNF